MRNVKRLRTAIFCAVLLLVLLTPVSADAPVQGASDAGCWWFCIDNLTLNMDAGRCLSGGNDCTACFVICY